MDVLEKLRNDIRGGIPLGELTTRQQLDELIGGADLLLSAASSVPAWALGAGAALGQLQREPDEPGVARAYGRQVADRFTYEPRTEFAQRAKRAAGEATAPLFEPVAKAAQYIDDKARDHGLGDLLDAGSVATGGIGAIIPARRFTGPQRFDRPSLLADEPLQPTLRTLQEHGEDLPSRVATRHRNLNKSAAPAARRRDRAYSGDVLIDAKEMPPLIEARPEDWAGSPLIAISGDRSATGGDLLEFEGLKMASPIPLQGGALFSPQHQGTGIGWASNFGAARNRQNLIDAVAEQTGVPPIGVYMAMGRDANDFSVPPSEIIWQGMDAAGVSKKDKESLAAAIRKRGKSNNNDYKGEPFKGFNEEGHAQLRASGALRNVFMDEIESGAKWRELGVLPWRDVRDYTTQPELRDVPALSSGFTAFRGAPGGALLRDYGGHESYDTAIPGEYIGGLKHQVPIDIMYRDPYRFRKGKPENNINRSIQISGAGPDSAPSWQIATPEWVDAVSEYQALADEMGPSAAAEATRRRHPLY